MKMQAVNSFFGRTKDVAKVVKNIAGDVVATSKEYIGEYQLNKQLDSCYKQLGELFFQSLHHENVDGERIDQLSDEIEVILEALETVHPRNDEVAACPNCKQTILSKSKYCSYCGKEIQ